MQQYFIIHPRMTRTKGVDAKFVAPPRKKYKLVVVLRFWINGIEGIPNLRLKTLRKPNLLFKFQQRVVSQVCYPPERGYV